MAYLQLFPNGDSEIRDLPSCCMRCGAAAATIVRQRFSTAHYFVTVHVPMCNKHRFHWRFSALLVVGSLIGSGSLISFSLGPLSAFADNSAGAVGVRVAFILLALFGVAAFALSIMVHRRQIRLVDQFPDSFVLANVCAAFVEALEAMTEQRQQTIGDYDAHFTWRFSEERFKSGGDEGYRR